MMTASVYLFAARIRTLVRVGWEQGDTEKLSRPNKDCELFIRLW